LWEAYSLRTKDNLSKEEFRRLLEKAVEEERWGEMVWEGIETERVAESLEMVMEFYRFA
jgi:histone H3/H4